MMHSILVFISYRTMHFFHVGFFLLYLVLAFGFGCWFYFDLEWNLEEKWCDGCIGRASPIKTNINSHLVFAADDAVALQPTNVFLLEVDLLSLRFLHEDHRPTQVEIPYRSVCVFACVFMWFCLLFFFFSSLHFNGMNARTCHIFGHLLHIVWLIFIFFILCVCVVFVIQKICKKKRNKEWSKQNKIQSVVP